MKKITMMVLMAMSSAITYSQDQKLSDREHTQKIDQVLQIRKLNTQETLTKSLQWEIDADKAIQKAESFQLGRLLSQKEKDIEDAKQQKENIVEYRYLLKKELTILNKFKYFDFQKTPKGVIEYIIKSAQEHNFENFRYLCDPYKEGVDNVTALCNMQIISEAAFFQEEYRKFLDGYQNARVMGEPVIQGNRAVIEIATGMASNKLVKTLLINRNGYWYLATP